MGRTSDARERLLGAARQLFYSRGYQNVGVADICDAAGVKKGSFYHFFPSKQDLILAMVEEEWRSVKKEFLDPIFATGQPPLEQIGAYFDALAAWAGQSSPQDPFKGCAFGNLGMEMSLLDEDIRQRIAAIFEEYSDYFTQSLSRAKAAGDWRGENPALHGKALHAYSQGAIALTHQKPELLFELKELALSLLRTEQASVV